MVKKWHEKSPPILYLIISIGISSLISAIYYWAGFEFSFFWWFLGVLFVYIIILNIKSGRYEPGK